jgi:hypothetical protein
LIAPPDFWGREQSRHTLNANGTAIEGVCVTGEAIRPDVPVVSKERVPVASRYGVIFAIMVRVGYGAIAVQGDGYLMIGMIKRL